MAETAGLLLAGAALVLWSISPFFFTGTGRLIGPFATNLLRLLFAFIALVAIVAAMRAFGHAAPMPGLAAWIWLGASGVVGLTVGDAYLYKAFVSVGPERTSQIQTLAPAATAAIAWVALREFLSGPQILGMALILGGVLMATTSAARNSRMAALGNTPDTRAAKAAAAGIWAAIWSALFQAVGTVLARQAFKSQPDLDPVLATAIRVGAGTAALWGYARWLGPIKPALGSWREPRALKLMAVGVLFGPLLGMLCYVAALKSAPAGLVTTITFMAPLLIIPIGAVAYGTRVTAASVWGTALSLGGVALLGLG